MTETFVPADFTVSKCNVLPRELTIYDARGSRVMVRNFTITAPYASMDVDMRNLGKGVYWIELGD